MRTMARTATWLALLALLLHSAWAAPRQGSGQAQQKPPAPPAQPAQPGQAPTQAEPATPPVNAEEEAAYKAFFETKANETQNVINLGEAFVKKFSESRYRETIYSRLASAYLAAGQEDKMFVAGEKVLELNPNNVDTLALMGMVISRRINPGSLDADQRLQKSEKYSKQAIALLTEMPKPAGLTDEDFARAKNEKLSMSHSGLGFVYYHRQKFADSAAEFDQATKLTTSPDPVDFFLLGLVLQQTKRHADAATAFGHCVEIAGPLQDRCKQGMEQAKKVAATQLTAPKP